MHSWASQSSNRCTWQCQWGIALVQVHELNSAVYKVQCTGMLLPCTMTAGEVVRASCAVCMRSASCNAHCAFVMCACMYRAQHMHTSALCIGLDVMQTAAGAHQASVTILCALMHTQEHAWTLTDLALLSNCKHRETQQVRVVRRRMPSIESLLSSGSTAVANPCVPSADSVRSTSRLR
jgi:hypothetical protein